jgi:hypothetical protein
MIDRRRLGGEAVSEDERPLKPEDRGIPRMSFCTLNLITTALSSISRRREIVADCVAKHLCFVYGHRAQYTSDHSIISSPIPTGAIPCLILRSPRQF